ncbi:MAG TPA: FG-GAP-like repeat-containing protein, partial [Isosphaeraceae bacterium]|nr:FG-GAP-like repeat-containing protein [Isosphaeraceae bacterium]
MCLIGWAARLVGDQHLRAELAQAKVEMSDMSFHVAHERLTRLAKAWPNDAEILFLLGFCEQGGGAPDAALAAWAQIPAGSPLAGRAAVQRGRLAMELGRLREAEESLRIAARDPGPETSAARHVLPLLLGQEGRLAEGQEWIEIYWRTTNPKADDDRADLLHDHIALEFETIPIEGNLAIVGKRRGATEDDRVWLSRANLAIRTGDFAEARKWLDACDRRAPNDPVVWRARLELALAAGQVAEVFEALAHLPDELFAQSRVCMLRAWLARQRGNVGAERQALERLVELEPANSAALERLADLSAGAGETESSRKLLSRKAEVDGIKDRYRSLFKTNALAANAKEMARLAERLGRKFESQGFLTLLSPGNPERRAINARLERSIAPPPEPGSTVAQQLAAEFGAVEAAGQALNKPAATSTPPHFEDGARASGLNAFIFDNGVSPLHQLPETFSGGVALFDYDGDGWLDVYALQGGAFPEDPARPYQGDRLFHNRGDGTFEDASISSGIEGMRRGYGHAAAVGDFDNDGHPDLFITRWRSYALYRNKGNGTFEDVTEHAGLGGDRDWPTSAAWADLDNDGDLDLYVCHYLQWDPATSAPCHRLNRPEYMYCMPRL